MAPDQIAVTGDPANLSLEREFGEADDGFDQARRLALEAFAHALTSRANIVPTSLLRSDQ